VPVTTVKANDEQPKPHVLPARNAPSQITAAPTATPGFVEDFGNAIGITANGHVTEFLIR
jgi:hypothetical protein